MGWVRGGGLPAAAVLAAWAGLVAAPLPLAAEPANDTPLGRALARALDGRALRGAQVAALAVDDAGGRELFARDPDRALVPASNLKILTALAALRVFGPAHRFTTRVLVDVAPDPEGAVGHLYVQGGGDPGLTSEDLWRLAADLRREGLRRVRGDLVIDDALFDDVRWHPSWLPVSARAYHAPVGALMVNYGAFAVAVRAGASPGDPVHVAIDPPVDFLRVVNRARTARAGAPMRSVVDRRVADTVEEVVVGGEWPARSRKTYYRSVLDPGLYAAAVLRLQLEGLGIRVDGATRRGGVPKAALELLAFEGRPVSDVVGRFLKYSSNPTGEALVKAMAANGGVGPGSWQAGVVAVRRELEALGLPTAGLVQVDGSGLSYHNRVTPRLFVAALREARRSFRYGAELVTGLPIGGTDGTLEKRAEAAGAALRAKTGLLNRVTGLSGLVERPDGSTAVFSVLINGHTGSAESAMGAADAFAAALAEVP